MKYVENLGFFLLLQGLTRYWQVNNFDLSNLILFAPLKIENVNKRAFDSH